MTRAFTRHARMIFRSSPSIVGTGTQYLPIMALGLCFVLTCIGVTT